MGHVRGLERLGRTGLRSALRTDEQRDALDVIVRASGQLARQRRGALIVVERETGLQEVIDTGIALDSELSVELLLSIFVTSSPLHDGAAIVHGNRLVAAGCTLPLSEAPLPAEYGMRHRAAIGLTERSDAAVIIISEERGVMSIASSGRLVPDLDEVPMSRQLHRLFDLIAHESSEMSSQQSTVAGHRIS